MRYFFLWYIINFFLGNPLLALLIVGAIIYFSHGWYSGQYYNPGRGFQERQEIRHLYHEVELNPHNVSSQNDLGRILARQGKFSQALSHLEAAIGRSQDSPETNYYLGYTYLNVGREEEGKAHIEKALALKPDYLYGEPYLRWGNYHLEKGEFDKSIELYEKFLSIHTSSSEGFYKLGQSYLEIGDREKAVEALQAAIQSYRQSPKYKKGIDRPWRFRAGRTLRKIGGKKQ